MVEACDTFIDIEIAPLTIAHLEVTFKPVEGTTDLHEASRFKLSPVSDSETTSVTIEDMTISVEPV